MYADLISLLYKKEAPIAAAGINEAKSIPESNPYPLNRKIEENRVTPVSIERIDGIFKNFPVLMVRNSDIITTIQKTIKSANMTGFHKRPPVIIAKNTSPLRLLLIVLFILSLNLFIFRFVNNLFSFTYSFSKDVFHIFREYYLFF